MSAIHMVPCDTFTATLPQWMVCEHVTAVPGHTDAKLSWSPCRVTEEKAVCLRGWALGTCWAAATWPNWSPFTGFAVGTWLMGWGPRDLVPRLPFPVLRSSILRALTTGSLSTGPFLWLACDLLEHWFYSTAFPVAFTLWHLVHPSLQSLSF